MSKSVSELAQELGLALISHNQINNIAKLPYSEQPKALLRATWDGLSLDRKEALINQFGYELEEADYEHTDWGRDGLFTYTTIVYAVQFNRYCDIDSSRWKNHKEEALDEGFDFIIDEFDHTLILNAFKNPLLSITEALYEVF